MLPYSSCARKVIINLVEQGLESVIESEIENPRRRIRSRPRLGRDLADLTARSYSIENVTSIGQQNGTPNGITGVHGCVRLEFIVCIIHKSAVRVGPSLEQWTEREGGRKGEREREREGCKFCFSTENETRSSSRMVVGWSPSVNIDHVN